MIIQGQHFLVEISYNDKGLYVALYSMEDSKKNLMQAIENPEKVTNILSAFNNNFETLARHVRIVKGQIKIRKPDDQEGYISSNLDSVKKRSAF